MLPLNILWMDCIGALLAFVIHAGGQSAGSCYDSTTHKVTCNVTKTACGGYWYELGYESASSGCCHCKAGCATVSSDCEYYDAADEQEGSCYDMTTHKVTCNVKKSACREHWYEPGYKSERSGCCHCKAGCATVSSDCEYYDTAEEQEGSCYDMTTHKVTCNVKKSACGEYWYEPGYKSARSGCCHCKAGCANVSSDCEYYDTAEEQEGSCYDMTTHKVTCNVKKSACGEHWYEPGYKSARSGCCHCKAGCATVSSDCEYYDAAEEQEGSCYDMTTHKVTCNVKKSACGQDWYEPGYKSERSGCCHCKAGCAKVSSDCEYYDATKESLDAWGCYDRSIRSCVCSVAEADCAGVWTRSCTACMDSQSSPSSSPASSRLSISLCVLIMLLLLAPCDAGAGCYDVETHKCDCTMAEDECHQKERHWTDGCNSCDADTNTHHPECKKEYSWGCFDVAAHRCNCQISERTCEQTNGSNWNHECWSCCHTSSWGCYVPGDGAESGCHCGFTETSCKLDFPDATWSHQCHECSLSDAIPAREEHSKGQADNTTSLVLAIVGSIAGTAWCILMAAGVYFFRLRKAGQAKPATEPYVSPPLQGTQIISGIVQTGKAVQ